MRWSAVAVVAAAAAECSIVGKDAADENNNRSSVFLDITIKGKGKVCHTPTGV